MPKRIIDGEAIWTSLRLRELGTDALPALYYLWLLPTATANGTFECDADLIWRSCFSWYQNWRITPKEVESFIQLYHEHGLLFLWTNGRRWGYWIGIEKPGRLPGTKRINTHQLYCAVDNEAVPWREVAEYKRSHGWRLTDEERAQCTSLLPGMEQTPDNLRSSSVAPPEALRSSSALGIGIGIGSGIGIGKEGVEPKGLSAAASPSFALHSPNEGVVLTILLNDKTEFEVTELQLASWADAYGSVNVLQVLKEIKQWSIANPRKRKTRDGIMEHIRRWLSKEQDRGGSNGHNPKARTSTSPRSGGAYHGEPEKKYTQPKILRTDV